MQTRWTNTRYKFRRQGRIGGRIRSRGQLQDCPFLRQNCTVDERRQAEHTGITGRDVSGRRLTVGRREEKLSVVEIIRESNGSVQISRDVDNALRVHLEGGPNTQNSGQGQQFTSKRRTFCGKQRTLECPTPECRPGTAPPMAWRL